MKHIHNIFEKLFDFMVTNNASEVKETNDFERDTCQHKMIVVEQ